MARLSENKSDKKASKNKNKKKNNYKLLSRESNLSGQGNKMDVKSTNKMLLCVAFF